LIYKTLFGIDIVAAVIVGYFFFAGLADGSISAFNIQLWVGIIFVVVTIIASGVALRRAAKPVFANIVLAVLAVPVVLYGIFIGAVVITVTPWN